MKEQAIIDGNLTFRDVSNNFWKGIEHLYTPRGRFGKGAFVTYAGEPEEAQDDDEDAHVVED